jgi:protein-S-isoprenylcysteine O-methyltransferase Ste14
MFNSFLETALAFLGQNWQSIPLAERFIYTPWVIVAVLYLILGYYDRLHNRIPTREVYEANFRSYLYSSCIGPYAIFIGLREYHGVLPFEFDSDIVKVISFILAFIGVIFVSLGRIQLNGYWGPDIYEYKDPSDRKIIRTGLYKRTRHPIYFGQWLIVIGTGLSTQNGAFLISTSALALAFIIVRAKREERYMLETLGNSWTDYYRKTGFFPWNL